MSYLNNKPPVEVVVEESMKMDEDYGFESNIAAYVKQCFEQAKVARAEITERLLKCERQRRGVYDPDKEADIRRMGGSDIYMMLTDVKCRAAESWIRDVMFGQQDRVFALTPANAPAMPPEMQQAIVDLVRTEAEQYVNQDGGPLHPETFRARMEEVHEMIMQRLSDEAEDAARRMGNRIEDQLNEGKFEPSLKAFITDFTTFPTAIMKGPTVKRRKVMKWGPNYVPIVATEFVRECERVSPYDIYPAPSSTGVDDGYIIQRHRLSRGSLEALSGTPGIDENALSTVVQRFGKSGHRSFQAGDTERRYLEGKPFRTPVNEDQIETLEFWGSVNGQWLIEWGLADKTIDPDREYEVNLWWTANIVWKCILNPDPLGRRPYDISSWEEIPHSFWGKALPEIMRDTQVMCNAAARSLANNMAIASGPQAEVTVDRLPDGEDLTDMYPWKIWQVTSDRTGGGQRAIQFFQPNMNADVLMSVYQNFARQADEVTGIPNYVYGSSNVSGAGRTASGLSMLMDNASKGIKQAVANIDKIVSGIVQRLYMHNMMYEADPYIKGDFKVVAKGAIGLIHKEALQMRRNEFLQATANPVDLQIVGPQGRAYLLREAARGLQMDTNKIVPPDSSFAQPQGQDQAAQEQVMQQQLQEQVSMVQQQASEQISQLEQTIAGLQQDMSSKQMEVNAKGGTEIRKAEIAADAAIRMAEIEASAKNNMDPVIQQIRQVQQDVYAMRVEESAKMYGLERELDTVRRLSGFAFPEQEQEEPEEPEEQPQPPTPPEEDPTYKVLVTIAQTQEALAKAMSAPRETKLIEDKDGRVIGATSTISRGS